MKENYSQQDVAGSTCILSKSLHTIGTHLAISALNIEKCAASKKINRKL